ncbi:hypothetical protein Ccrd_002341 [Cynara cardunculus var. scolymus]|uniref:ZN622/Rei1/Reh1 zinc finger C2H2-type domain-containing protein n=1 Tax=Cynara cardunculus var. scolymus TaxID=59895 RepID=A0A103XRN8_CYNCS|nr:hypothetical protein Ccrd_002341 [Cynara cardunculus var. scolymus]
MSELTCNKQLIDESHQNTHYDSEWHRYNLKRKSDEETKDKPDPTCCFMCDKKHKTIENCMVHMHKHHGFFVPDIDYLKDPIGLLTHLGLQVKHDYKCLYCKHICRPFDSLEAVRNHMVAKSHCKVHYGDAFDEEEEAELEEFYDYSSSYVDENGKQLVIGDGTGDRIELGTGGSELMITRPTGDRISTKIIGSREYLRYYRQKPRPSPNTIPATAMLASRHRSVCMSTVQAKEKMVTKKLMNTRSRVETTRTKIGMKNNVIRNFPKSVSYLKR